MPQVCSEKLSLKRKRWLQEQMASLEVVPRKKQVSQSEYWAVHHWIKSNYKKPERCFVCLKIKSLDWACIKKYEKNIESFKALCHKCHMIMDLGSRTHCKVGHELTKENTYSYPKDGRVGCRMCRKIYSRNWWRNNMSKNKSLQTQTPQQVRG